MKSNIVKRFKKNYIGYLMIAPLFIGLLVFAYYPAIYGVIISLFQKGPEGSVIFNGFKNYVQLFNDEIFLKSIPTMFYIMVPKLIISVTVPFIAAELLYAVRSAKLKNLYRILILLPMIAPGVVGTLIWKAVYDPNGGVMTAIMRVFHIVDRDTAIDWLGSPSLVIFSIIFMGFPWIGGTNVLIYLAGLNSISKDVIESSILDGATPLKRVFLVDIPLMLGQVRYFLVFGIIGGLQDYSVQVLLTNGGPGYQTYVPGYYMYQQAFMFNNKYYASTIGVVLFVVVMVFTMFVNKTIRRDKVEV